MQNSRGEIKVDRKNGRKFASRAQVMLLLNVKKICLLKKRCKDVISYHFGCGLKIKHISYCVFLRIMYSEEKRLKRQIDAYDEICPISDIKICPCFVKHLTITYSNV